MDNNKCIMDYNDFLSLLVYNFWYGFEVLDINNDNENNNEVFSRIIDIKTKLRGENENSIYDYSVKKVVNVDAEFVIIHNIFPKNDILDIPDEIDGYPVIYVTMDKTTYLVKKIIIGKYCGRIQHIYYSAKNISEIVIRGNYELDIILLLDIISEIERTSAITRKLIFKDCSDFIYENNCLLSKDRKHLYYAFERKKIFIPPEVEYIHSRAFLKTINLTSEIKWPKCIKLIESLVIPPNTFFKIINNNPIDKYLNLEEINNYTYKLYVDNNTLYLPNSVKKIDTDIPFGYELDNIICNDNFIFSNRLLFSKDMKTLILSLVKESIIDLPETIENINKNAVLKSNNVSFILHKNNKHLIEQLEKFNYSFILEEEKDMKNDSNDEMVSIFTRLKEKCDDSDNIVLKFYVSRKDTINIKKTDISFYKYLDPYFIYLGEEGEIDIPYGVLQIKGIDYETYEEIVKKPFITSVIIPDTVTKIDSFAFAGFTSLTYITIPDSVTEIGPSAFLGCTSLKSIIIPDNVKMIDENAFKDCTNLESIIIGNSVNVIKSNSFFNCTSLKSINVNKYNNTFYSKRNCLINKTNGQLILCMGNAEIPNDGTILSIGEYSFYGNDSITSIVLPASITEIGKYAFSNCTSMVSILLPENLKKLGEGAFKGCTSLKSITLGENIKEIKAFLFQGCSSLSTINIDCKVKCIERYAFSKCVSLKSIVIPDGVTQIKKYAFEDCHSLSSITLSDSITALSEGAFIRCKSLKEIILPLNIDRIYKWVFASCPSLTDIYFYGNEKQWKDTLYSMFFEYKLSKKIKVHYNWRKK